MKIKMSWGRVSDIQPENSKINLAFRSLIRNFEINLEGTHVRKCSNKFGISLTYS